MRSMKRGMSQPTPQRGQIVAFATADLGIECLEQFRREIRTTPGVERDLVVLGQPVEIAPDFAT